MGDQPIQKIHELIKELTKRLALGESFDNPKLTQIADQALGGTRAQGVCQSPERSGAGTGAKASTERVWFMRRAELHKRD